MRNRHLKSNCGKGTLSILEPEFYLLVIHYPSRRSSHNARDLNYSTWLDLTRFNQTIA